MRAPGSIALSALLAWASTGLAQEPVEVLRSDEVARPVRASLKTFEWLVGQWQGEGFGGEVEEIWTGPAGSAMQGMFRLVVDREVRLYELMTLVDEDGQVTLKVKHFGPDFRAWEEKTEHAAFDLLRLSPNRYQFDGITWVHNGNQLTMHLVVADSSGSERIERLELERRSHLVTLD